MFEVVGCVVFEFEFLMFFYSEDIMEIYVIILEEFINFFVLFVVGEVLYDFIGVVVYYLLFKKKDFLFIV